MEDHKRMEDLKEEYMSLKPPGYGLEELEQTIARAKRDKRKRAKIRRFRNAVTGMAAAFAGIFVLVNVNADIACAMAKLPVIGKVVSVITMERYQSEGENYHVDIKKPRLESEENVPGIEEVNKAVEQDTEELIEMCRKEFSEELCEDVGSIHYSVDADYEIVTDTEDWFVLCLSVTEIRASGQQNYKYYTIDRKTGEMVALSDLFREESDYAAVISENIKEQMRTQMAEDSNKVYFLDHDVSEWNFQQIASDQSFYINKDGELVISFDKYEVAPGYMGSVSFLIPRSVIEPVLKQGY